MRDYHGIIFAYHDEPALRDLTANRTAASLPFCSRYRLIDFALSSLRNAGILDVGVIMQRDYQSLLDHIGSSKAWDMSRKHGGLRMLPPFGLPQYHTGNYNGTIEALNAVSTYIRRIPQKHVVLLLGNMAANIDLDAVIRQHEKAGTDATAICAGQGLESRHSNYLPGEDGLVQYIDLFRTGEAKGIPSLEGYIFNKDKLLELMDVCQTRNLFRFHQDAMTYFLYEAHGKMDIYVHPGYARIIRTVDEYYAASKDVLRPEVRRELFPADRPVRTKIHEDVSTYYGEQAKSRNSLVGDNCIIDGEIEDCIIFSGCHIGAGAKLKGCILMRDCVVGENARLEYIISDKQAVFSPGSVLIGSPNLPTVVPKDGRI